MLLSQDNMGIYIGTVKSRPCALVPLWTAISIAPTSKLVTTAVNQHACYAYRQTRRFF